jgi:hypothetical protein
MQEQENNSLKDPIEIADQQATHMLELIRGAEFGSSVHQAASDYFAKKDLEDDIESTIGFMDSFSERAAREFYWQSELRIKEMSMALLENEIRNKTVLIPDYSKIYNGLYGLDAGLNDESRNNFMSAARKIVLGITNSGNPLENTSTPE